jgi:hypothetical protein
MTVLSQLKKTFSILSLVSIIALTFACRTARVDSDLGSNNNNTATDTATPDTTNELRPPVVGQVTPTLGDVSGGTRIVVKGAYFKDGAKVYVGNTECENVGFISSSELRCKTPAAVPGSYDIEVENPNGDRFSLDDAEKIKLRLNKISESKKFEDEIELSNFGIPSDDKRRISIQTSVNGIIKPRLEEIFSLIYNQIESSGFAQLIPAGIVLTGGGAMTVNVKEICNHIIPLPLRVATPPKVGGIVDDIMNPAYTSTIGLLIHNKNAKRSGGSGMKSANLSMGAFFAKVKKALEPLLP